MEDKTKKRPPQERPFTTRDSLEFLGYSAAILYVFLCSITDKTILLTINFIIVQSVIGYHLLKSYR